jgi:hypothetical protein
MAVTEPRQPRNDEAWAKPIDRLEGGSVMAATEPRQPRNDEAWAKPIDRLAAGGVIAPLDTVTGRRVTGPVQGFGRMFQKTFRVRLAGSAMSPPELITLWKDQFATFWPKSGRFYAPLAGIAPGEVALLDLDPLPMAPVRLSTGVMVLYADDESFTFMTPEGHTLSAWITFSAFRENEVTVAQAQALERAADPLDEVAYVLFGSRRNNTFWEQTLAALARRAGVIDPLVETQVVLVDRRRQWRYVRNLRHSATIGSAVATITAPVRWARRRRVHR